MEADPKNSKLCIKYIVIGSYTKKIRSIALKMAPIITDYAKVTHLPPPPFSGGVEKCIARGIRCFAAMPKNQQYQFNLILLWKVLLE